MSESVDSGILRANTLDALTNELAARHDVTIIEAPERRVHHALGSVTSRGTFEVRNPVEQVVILTAPSEPMYDIGLLRKMLHSYAPEEIEVGLSVPRYDALRRMYYPGIMTVTETVGQVSINATLRSDVSREAVVTESAHQAELERQIQVAIFPEASKGGLFLTGKHIDQRAQHRQLKSSAK